VNDVVGGVPLVVVVNEDRVSARVFERRVDGKRLDFFARTGVSPLVLVDTQTGSEWSFSGAATSGPLKGRALHPVAHSKEYWFDWKLHRPQTTVFLRRSEDAGP
jgi:hypothetical protein